MLDFGRFCELGLKLFLGLTPEGSNSITRFVSDYFSHLLGLYTKLLMFILNSWAILFIQSVSKISLKPIRWMGLT